FGIVAYQRLPVSDLPTIDFPTINVNASLPGASPETMASAVATPLERQFSTIAGIDAMTSTSGLGTTGITLQFALDRDIDAAVRVQLDPSKLASQKIGIDEVASAISAQNVNMPTGVLWGPNKAYTVQANGQLQDAAGFRELVVTYRNGVPVHLGDIGQVLDDVQNNHIASWYDGKRGLILGVQRQPGTNT